MTEDISLFLWCVAIPLAIASIALLISRLCQRRRDLIRYAHTYGVSPGRWWSNAQIRRAIIFRLQAPPTFSREWIRLFAADRLRVASSRVEVTSPQPGMVRIAVRGARAAKLRALQEALAEVAPVCLSISVERNET